MRVALFITCVNDLAFPQTGIATVALLERLGVGVDFPHAQTCCGQMQYNTGYPDEARPAQIAVLPQVGGRARSSGPAT